MDPLLPKFTDNPLGYALAKADQGKFVRPFDAYLSLLKSSGKGTFEISKNKRWPVPVILTVLSL